MDAPSFLVCCESSGMVREAMRAHGVDAWSCDLLSADDGSQFHIQGDCREAMRSRKWTGFGLHCDCTYLTVAGVHWNNRGRGWDGTRAALDFVRECMAIAGDAPWYLENPVSIISTHICKPTQTIQPYQFGEDASKRTCLWLNRLAPLTGTRRVSGRIVEWPRGSGKMVERWSNQTDSGQNRLGPSRERWKARSRTYPGIAAAMAAQWHPILFDSMMTRPASGLPNGRENAQPSPAARRGDATARNADSRNPEPVCADCGRDLPADGYCQCANTTGEAALPAKENA